MGNGRSRDSGDVATLRQGLELIGRWALLLARKSPQLIDRWEQLEERLQTAEADIEIMQETIGRVSERLTRLEDREKARETRVSALETSVEKALSTMFPRVDALLTHLEQQKNSTVPKAGSVSKENHAGDIVSSESVNSKSPSVAEIPSVGGKRKRRQKASRQQECLERALVSSLDCSVSSQISPVPTKRLAIDSNIAVATSTVPSTSSTSDASPSPSTSSSSSSSVVPQDDKDEALLSAVVGGRIEDLRSLLASGADVNVVNIYGQTPVAYAASRGYTECLSALLFAGGFVNREARDSDGHLPIHAAAYEGQVATLPLLLSAGADINARTEPAAQTPLMLAALRGHFDFLSLLLRSGANINMQDNLGETALHKAVRTGSKQAISLLLDAGASVNLSDKSGRFPLVAAHATQGKRIKRTTASARKTS